MQFAGLRKKIQILVSTPDPIETLIRDKGNDFQEQGVKSHEERRLNREMRRTGACAWVPGNQGQLVRQEPLGSNQSVSARGFPEGLPAPRFPRRRLGSLHRSIIKHNPAALDYWGLALPLVRGVHAFREIR